MAMMQKATTTVKHWRLLDPSLWEMACHWQLAKRVALLRTLLRKYYKSCCESARNGSLFREREYPYCINSLCCTQTKKQYWPPDAAHRGRFYGLNWMVTD